MSRHTSIVIDGLRLFSLAVLGISMPACEQKSEAPYAPEYSSKQSNTPRREYLFAVHPLHNPSLLFEAFQPVLDLINSSTSEFALRLEASRDYRSYEEKLNARKFHFALPNPYQTLQSLNFGYRVFGKMGDDNQFRGIILVRRDGGVNSIEDLRNGIISFPARTALAATFMPKYFLAKHGLNVDSSADCRYVGSQESSIMNVYMGHSLAGCTWPPPWEALISAHPEVGRDLVVKWQTEPLVNNGLVVRDDIPAEHVEVVSNVIFSLQTHAKGRAILQRLHLSRFESATNATYAPVAEFLRSYENIMGPIENVKVRQP